MATNVKSASEVGQKWARVTPQRTEDYTSGVRNPKTDWKTATQAAESRYKEGITKSIARGAFGKGVAAAGTAAWQKGAVEKSNRWGEGVAVGQSKYEQNVSPYLYVIKNTNLPDRYPKGDPRNIQRVAVLASALRAKKESK